MEKKKIITAKELVVEFSSVVVLNYFTGIAAYGANTGGGQNLLTISLTSALCIATMVRFGGPITGVHINPILSVIFAIDKKIKWVKALLYILAQVLGSIFSGLLLWSCLPKLDNEVPGY
jgi:glycerol uptake facilitator-like aquaporin